MRLVGEYSGIGKVYTSHNPENQFTFEKLRQLSVLPASKFQTTVSSWLNGDVSQPQAIFSFEVASSISREVIESLERRGIGCVRYNDEMQLGGFALDAFSPAMQGFSAE